MSPVEPLPAALAASLADLSRHFGVPGLAIALAAPGGCRSIFCTGFDAAGSERAVGENTWFSLASAGKHVTAMKVMQLARAGRVELDAPVGRYLQGMPAEWAQRSVASLLHHTSGLPEYLAHEPTDGVPTRRVDFFATYGSRAPVFDAGRSWSYSNTNYILLGFLIAEVTGLHYAESVQGVFDEFRCDGIAVAGPQWARDVNAGIVDRGSPDLALQQREVIGDGDIAATPAGALAWLDALLGERLLDAPWRARMLSPALLATGRPALYGCGWFVDSFAGVRVGFHGGHFDGWTALCYIAPLTGCGVVAMCNVAPGNTRAIRYLAQRALEGWRPGTTPLGLQPITDPDPAFTQMARSQLLRQGTETDPACLAEELQPLSANGDPARPMINLWSGAPPDLFQLVDHDRTAMHDLRLYRIAYADRMEHVRVGRSPEGLIHWAWPL